MPLPARRSALGLCEPCRQALPEIAPDAAVCAGCGRRLDTPSRPLPSGWRCGTCRERPPSFDRLLAVWRYEPPLDAVVLALKFGRLEYLGRHLGDRMAERLTAELDHDLEWAARLAAGAAVVPVPLHWRRKLRRGYNQAESIALPLAETLGLPLRRSLRRRRATARQTSLSRLHRRRSLDGAFTCRRRPPEETVLLVDDVATTGATLDAAAACLRRAGVQRVLALVAAHTPRRADDSSTDLASQNRQ